MIGRSQDVAQLVRQLEAGNHQILAGARRTGKTSVCDAAESRLRGKGAYVVKVDMFAHDSLSSLSAALVRETIANRPAVHRVLPKLVDAGRAALRGTALTVSAKMKAEFGQEIDIGFSDPVARRDPDRAFEWALRFFGRVAQADDRPVLVYLDEFQELAAHGHRFGDPDVLTKKMRAVLQRSPRVTCLFVGSIEHMMRDLFATRTRAFYKFGGFYDLSSIEESDWRDGLAERFGKDGCTLDATALAQVLSYGEGHPRATMLVAQQAHMVAVESASRRLELAMVHEGFATAMDLERAGHESEVARMRDTGRHTLAVARSVSRAERVYSAGRLDPRQVGRALDALRNIGVVHSTGRGEWRITDPLLRRYLENF